ncbi:UNVERIFIED_ORG: hypothetical protein ABIC48_005687 [Burkholderia territorii]
MLRPPLHAQPACAATHSRQYTHNTGGASNQVKMQSGQMSVSQWG